MSAKKWHKPNICQEDYNTLKLIDFFISQQEGENWKKQKKINRWSITCPSHYILSKKGRGRLNKRGVIVRPFFHLDD